MSDHLPAPEHPDQFDKAFYNLDRPLGPGCSAVDAVTIGHRTADLLGLCDTHRWTIIKTSRFQSVAEHSFSVAVIALALAEELGERDPVFLYHLLRWALVHDGPESMTGDIDGLFKRQYPAVRAAVVEGEEDALPWYREEAAGVRAGDPRVPVLVKVADHIEAATWIKVWGVGARADHIYQTLVAIIVTEDTVNLARVMGIDPLVATVTVRSMVNNQVKDTNTYQLRHRTNHRWPDSK